MGIMLRCFVGVCAVVASACGQTAVSRSELTGAPSDPLPLEATCSREAPAAFAAEPRNGNAYLSWSAVPSAEAYEVEIHQVDSGARIAAHTLQETRWEWGGPPDLGQGPYRARVRAVTPCGTGEWSSDDVFILNRSGSVPNPPAAPAPAPPPAVPAMVACGTLQGQYVVNLLGTTFQKGDPPVYAPLALPAGTYRVDVETNDASHQPGLQTQETQEVVTVWGVGTTQDIPEAATRQVTTFNATLPMLAQIVVEAGPDSVHGVCVAFVRQ